MVSILGPLYIPSIPLFMGGGPTQGTCIRLVEVSGLEVRVSDGSGSLGSQTFRVGGIRA